MARAITDQQTEQRRLDALRRFGAPRGEGASFDRITQLTAEILNAPIALISLVDECEQRFLSRVGLEAKSTSRDVAFCAYTILGDEVFYVEDACKDDRFKDNPLVTGAPNIRTYAGAPIITRDGDRLGALCAIFDEVTPLKPHELERLATLASSVMDQLALCQAIRDLERSEARQRQLVTELTAHDSVLGSMAQAAVIGAWSLDLTTETVWWSEETRRIHEVGDDFEPSLETALDFYPEAARGPVQDAVNTAIDKLEPFDISVPLITAKGRRVWVRSIGKVIATHGVPVRLVGAFQDITEQRRREKELKSTADRLAAYQFALDQHANVVMTDADRIITHANDQFCRTLGYESGAVIGAKINGFVAPPDEENEAGGALPVGRDPWHGELRYARRDGGRVWTDTSVVPFTDDQGEPTHFFFIGYDISERVKARAALDARTQELERAKRDLEREVILQAETAAALEVERAAAEAANATKSQFLATVSHEIRTPLNGVMGMIDLTLRTALSDGQRDNLTVARSSARNLLHIINDILDVSKFEAVGVDIVDAPYEPPAVIEDVAQLLGPRARDKGLAFTTGADNSLPRIVVGDAARVRQVLMNLVGNAIKFTAEGSISVRVERIDDPIPAIRFAVKDTGIGVADEAVPRVFQRFALADASITRRYGGTGLGLSISRELVEAMGGEIGVDSMLGRGSEFWFTLPLEMIEGAETDAVFIDDLDDGDIAEIVVMEPLKILAAEDHAVNQKVLQAFICAAGHELTLVENGREAVKRAERTAYDVILMDVQMPEMDGVTATQIIRAGEGPNQSTPIIAVTAHAMMSALESYLDAGMNACVTKPLDPAHLFEVLAEVAQGAEEDTSRGDGEGRAA